MSQEKKPKESAVAIALFALIIGSAGFFNTFDISSGRIRIPPAFPSVPYYFYDAQGISSGVFQTACAAAACPQYIQQGTVTITIGAGAASNTATVSFSPAFASVPGITLGLQGNPGGVGFLPNVPIPFFAADYNSTVLISDDETQTSSTIPNADTNLKTYSLALNGYSKVIVEAEGYVSFVTLSTNQIINIKIKNGAAQQGQTMKVDSAISATSSTPFSIKAAFVQTSAATLAITVGAAAADANTNVFLNSLRVYAVSSSEIWQNMPVASTEMFGSTNHRLFYAPHGNSATPATTTFLEVNCGLGSTAAGATLQMQYSPDQVTWTNVAGAVTVDNTASNCNTATGKTLKGTTGTVPTSCSTGCYFRVMGAGGGGAGDNPSFSGLYMVNALSGGLVYQIDHESDTTSGTTIRILRSCACATASPAITVNWRAMLPSSIPAGGTANQGVWIYPSLTTELFGSLNWRIPINLQLPTPIKKIRFFAEVASPAVSCFSAFTCGSPLSAFMWPQYSTDSGATWHDLCGDGTVTPSVDVTMSANNPQTSAFCDIQVGAFVGNALFRVVGYGGDDTTAAAFNGIAVEFA